MATFELEMTESPQAKVMLSNDTRGPCIVRLLLPNWIVIMPHAQPCYSEAVTLITAAGRIKYIQLHRVRADEL